MGGIGSYGQGMNDSDQVVGTFNTTDGPLHAFLYSGGVMSDLNNLIAPGSGFTLTIDSRPRLERPVSNT